MRSSAMRPVASATHLALVAGLRGRKPESALDVYQNACDFHRGVPKSTQSPRGSARTGQAKKAMRPSTWHSIEWLTKSLLPRTIPDSPGAALR